MFLIERGLTDERLEKARPFKPPMSKQFRVEWHNDGWIDIEGGELPKLRAPLFQKMRGMRVSSFFSLSSIVKLLLLFASSDAVIFHTGKFSHAARDRPQMLEWKIESDIAVKFAIRRIARITFLRTPNLAAGITVAPKRSRTSRRVTGRVNRAPRLRISKQKPVGIENEHPGYASEPNGSDHLVSLLQTIEGSKCKESTMVIVTYDEFGGQWDHVPPPGQGNSNGPHDQWGPGTRIPALVLSPHLQGPFVVDHTEYVTTSILATIEQRYDLKALASRDAAVASISNVFDAH